MLPSGCTLLLFQQLDLHGLFFSLKPHKCTYSHTCTSSHWADIYRGPEGWYKGQHQSQSSPALPPATHPSKHKISLGVSVGQTRFQQSKQCQSNREAQEMCVEGRIDTNSEHHRERKCAMVLREPIYSSVQSQTSFSACIILLWVTGILKYSIMKETISLTAKDTDTSLYKYPFLNTESLYRLKTLGTNTS